MLPILRYNKLSYTRFLPCTLKSLQLNLKTIQNNVPVASYTKVRFYQSQHGAYGDKPDAAPIVNQNYRISNEALQARVEFANIHRYICAYRMYGHLIADINPLKYNERIVPELDPAAYGLSLTGEGGSTVFPTQGLVQTDREVMTIAELDAFLKRSYSHKIGAEFMYLPTQEEREWWSESLESLSVTPLENEERTTVARLLLESQAWDAFLAIKFASAKRYGAEGAEGIIPYFTYTFDELSKDGVEEVMVGMSHRGRLNLLTGLLQVDPRLVFAKLKGLAEFPPEYTGKWGSPLQGSSDYEGAVGDVLSHIVASMQFKSEVGDLHVSLLPNPSHLEGVDPVVVGKTRGRQRRRREGHYATKERTDAKAGDLVACLQIHGDAALSGQGVIQETLQMSQIPNFSVGGSLHMCINNQVGYTTPAERGGSSDYCTDVAKMTAFPVIHVNGDDPESVCMAARTSVRYQRRFRRDVFVDLVCWRRWGHNELDNPSLTNPKMYQNINNRKSVPDVYVASLIEEGIMTQAERDDILKSYTAKLNAQLKSLDAFKPQVRITFC